MENFRLMYVALSQDLDINSEQLPRLATQNSFNFGLDLARVVVIVFENLCFVFKDVLGSLKLYRVECGKE
jgi:hypothetical protein